MGWIEDCWKIFKDVLKTPKQIYIIIKNIIYNNRINSIYKKINQTQKISQISDLDSKKEFINPLQLEKIVKENKKSVIAQSTSEIDLDKNIFFGILEKVLLSCKNINHYSKELWIASSLIIAEDKKKNLSFFDLDEIVTKLKKIGLTLDLKIIQEYWDSLNNIKKYGFFYTLFLRIIISARYLAENDIKKIINELIGWGKDYEKGKILGFKRLKIKDKEIVVCFVGENFSIPDGMVKEYLNKSYIFASLGEFRTERNFSFANYLKLVYKIPNIIIYEIGNFKKGEVVCFETWFIEDKRKKSLFKQKIPLNHNGICKLISKIKNSERRFNLSIENNKIILS
ncbi:hypothetical protein A3K82_02085 [Candidatus Pacearchaeota archaeon RBG_19FT_COMBO_34_9]|nr:MAG: hypothetical protein A3K82_02085 [Candidatus Pacearchaeota archaeon RBG_19FT_COMBO_34_9]